jgi:tRNA (guanine26-N2/guanine27-N2)-dimethyltransferase
LTVIREYIKILDEEKTAKGKEFNGVSILEALAATGLRSVRYLKEIDRIKSLVANDLDPKAVELIKKNMEFNGISQDKY